MSNFIYPIKKPTRRHPPKLGSIGVRLGQTIPRGVRPPTGAVWPELWLVVSHHLSNIGGIGIHGGIGLKNGGLPKIGRNQGNMPWEILSPPPIKGGHPVLITHTTHKVKSIPLELE